MSEERTRDLPDSRSFEERLFARLDAMNSRFDAMEAQFDARFNSVEARLAAMEARFDSRFDGLETRVQALEAKALDTKPIWERALAEIVEVKQSVEEVRGRVENIGQRVENIERKFDLLILDMMQLRGDQRRVEKRMDALESSPQ
jgi:chromosome segregation ATPase